MASALRETVWGARLWSFCFQFFVAERIARLGWTGHYSMERDFISDLGTARTSLHWVMNSSFVLQGLLIFFGAVLVRRSFPARPVDQAALLLLAIAGVGVLVVGLEPEGNWPFHILGAVANFLGGNLAMVLLGLVTIRRSACQPSAKPGYGWITFAAGSAGLLATLSLTFLLAPSAGGRGWDAGTVERFAAYPLPLWLTWTGWRMGNVRSG